MALFHFLPSNSYVTRERPSGLLSGFIGAGYVGVSFFFMLSGFILTYSHAHDFERGRALKSRFYVARFARIYPVYLVSMIAAALLYPDTFRVARHASVFLIDLLMLQSWSARTVLFFNIPAWTLSCEAAFYAIFPFLLLRLRPATRPRAIAGLLLTWGFALLPPVVALHHAFGWHWTLWGPEQPGVPGLIMLRNPLFAFPEFFAGVIVGWIHLRFPPAKTAALWLTAAGLVATLLPLLLAQSLSNSLLHNGLLIPAFSALLLGLASDTMVTRCLSVAPLLLLGEASYAFYLTHYLFNNWVIDHFHAGKTALDAVWKLAILLPLSIGLYLGVERPARRLILRFWDERMRRRATLAA